MSLDNITAAGPGDGKNRRGKKPEVARHGKLSLDPPRLEPRYVETPDGRTIWRPNAPGFPDLPGGAS